MFQVIAHTARQTLAWRVPPLAEVTGNRTAKVKYTEELEDLKISKNFPLDMNELV